MTVDNYDETKKKIFDILKENTDNQVKFLDVLFQKSVKEIAFVNIYAKLCKELDKELPQKIDGASSNKGIESKKTSFMRSKLLEKCREIFKVEDDSQIKNYIKGEDQEEKDINFKKFMLGNINFIGELISTQLLSKKIVEQCIANLIKKYENPNLFNNIRLISIEGVVIMINKFGTLINK